MGKLKLPNTYVIIAIILALCMVATWCVPGGNPQTWQLFTAFYHGFVKQAGIIVFILIVGGAFWLLNATGAVSAGISRFIARIGRYDAIVLVSISLLFSLGGAVLGMCEETIPFVGIMVPLVVSLGYDAFMGMLIVFVAASIGFSSAFLNPFTVGIAQGMADLPLFSGMEYRLFCWGFFTLLLIVFVLVYARKTKRKTGIQPTSGPTEAPSSPTLTRRQKWILVILLLTVVALIVGVTCWDWYLPEISGLFLLMGILCGVIAGFPANRIADEFIAGAKDILSAALVVGFASGIIVLLQDGQVIDTMLASLQRGLEGTSPATSLSAMYGIQALINFVIPSASAKAAATIPIMAPFADMVGVSRQAMVLAFQFGDGFTNLLTPTSGALMAALAMARIPYTKWVKWVWKKVVVLLILGLLLLLPTVLFPIPEF